MSDLNRYPFVAATRNQQRIVDWSLGVARRGLGAKLAAPVIVGFRQAPRSVVDVEIIRHGGGTRILAPSHLQGEDLAAAVSHRLHHLSDMRQGQPRRHSADVESRAYRYAFEVSSALRELVPGGSPPRAAVVSRPALGRLLLREQQAR